MNYGAAPGVQLHAIAPLAVAAGGSEPTRYGPGDLELGAKYRSSGPGRRPDRDVPPRHVPTGSHARGLGEGAATVFLPIWLQRNAGPWTTYGGGGYRIRAAAGEADSWFVGWQLQRSFGPVAVGAELYRRPTRPPRSREPTASASA